MVALGCEAEPPAAGMPQQQQRSAAQRPERASLCLELQAPRPNVQLGEPVTLIASLVNCSSSTQQVQDLLSPEYRFLQVWIQPPSGKEFLQRPSAIRDGRKPSRPLAPGERLSAFVPVSLDPDGWTIRQPGQYRVRAEYDVDGTRLESNHVSFTVTAPATAQEREAAELMMARETAMLIASGRDEGGEGSRRLITLQERYGQTGLADYARVTLAIAQSRDRFDPATKTFRNDGCERGVEQLARSVPEVRDPLLAASGTASWVRCLRQLGREQEANAAISRFFQTHPEARHVSSVAQSLGARAERKD